MNVFVSSKPLQFLNVKNIVDNGSYKDKILIIIGHFKDYESFALKLNEIDKTWDSIKVFKTRRSAYLSLFGSKITNLFLDRDQGLDYFFLRFLNFQKLIIYEEGYGTYNYAPVVVNQLTKFKSIVIGFLGSNKNIGQSKLCDEILVYFPDLYQKYNGNGKKVLAFNKNFIENLRDNYRLFESLFPGSKSYNNVLNKKILFYITT